MIIISLKDKDYPWLLKKIPDPPLKLYVKGRVEILSSPCFAIVGTRKTKTYEKLTFEIAYDLARAGLVIVSGLASGADTQAHKGALEAEGKTIACLASSLEENLWFPQENVRLAKKILASGGALVSEYKSKAPAQRARFPQRNRIISGISLGVLVTEAPFKSGAMITASKAKKQGRPIFALPGPPFWLNSQGPNKLIQQGAYLVTQASDILKILKTQGLFHKTPNIPSKKTFSQNALEAKILKALSQGPAHIDKLAQLTQIDIAALSSKLIELELGGLVKDLGGRIYTI